MSLAKRRAVTVFQKYLLNPFVRVLPGWLTGAAILETKGRRTGKRRRNPVGAKLRDGSYWVVSEHGRKSSYVRNIEADPNIRLRHKGRWHDVTAHLLDDEDPRKHAKGLNGMLVKLVGTELLAIRLDPR